MAKRNPPPNTAPIQEVQSSPDRPLWRRVYLDLSGEVDDSITNIARKSGMTKRKLIAKVLTDYVNAQK